MRFRLEEPFRREMYLVVVFSQFLSLTERDASSELCFEVSTQSRLQRVSIRSRNEIWYAEGREAQMNVDMSSLDPISIDSRLQHTICIKTILSDFTVSIIVKHIGT